MIKIRQILICLVLIFSGIPLLQLVNTYEFEDFFTNSKSQKIFAIDKENPVNTDISKLKKNLKIRKNSGKKYSYSQNNPKNKKIVIKGRDRLPIPDFGEEILSFIKDKLPPSGNYNLKLIDIKILRKNILLNTRCVDIKRNIFVILPYKYFIKLLSSKVKSLKTKKSKLVDIKDYFEKLDGSLTLSIDIFRFKKAQKYRKLFGKMSFLPDELYAQKIDKTSIVVEQIKL
jgi:hypothetical protein